MNLNKNSYIISFASIMVIVVAALLALTSIKLTPYQDRNIELEKKQNILQSIGFTKILRDSSWMKVNILTHRNFLQSIFFSLLSFFYITYSFLFLCVYE